MGGWDSDEEDKKTVETPEKKPVKNEGQGSKGITQLCNGGEGGTEASDWDDEDEDDSQRSKKNAATASTLLSSSSPPAMKSIPEDASMSMEPSGWDDDELEAASTTKAASSSSSSKKKEDKVDACGAQKNSACGAFVTAREPAVVGVAPTAAAAAASASSSSSSSGAGELDDLLGLALASDSSVPFKGSSSHGFVPNFHCTGCDFQVLRIENYVWEDSAAYMHFRNNYPNVMKLRAKLVPRKDCVAYCCQCSWKSAEAAASLSDVAEGLKWRTLTNY